MEQAKYLGTREERLHYKIWATYPIKERARACPTHHPHTYLPVNIIKRKEKTRSTPATMEIWNLRRHDDESKENVKQAERLCNKRTILHVPHPFFTALRRERRRNYSLLGDVFRRRRREKIRRDFQRTATAVKMSLKNWIGALSILNDYSYSVVTLSNAVEELNSSSSETQEQIKGARESLNGRKNIYGTKKSKERREEREENLCFSGTNQKPERRRPFGTGLVRHCPQGLFSPFFTIFVPYIFFRRFRLSLVPTICPWVSEDVNSLKPRSSSERERKFCRRSFSMFTSFILPDKLIGHFHVVVGQWG